MRIPPFTSLFLDGLRLFAALGVLICHASDSHTHLAPAAHAFEPYGHFFVVIFFVLSGYVIAATTNPERSDAIRYFSARLSRLWSVAIPSLLLALCIEKIGMSLTPDFFSKYDRGYSFLRYVLAATFTNEMWFVSAGPPLVSPVWSLAYEFWYYVIFGVAIFVRQPIARICVLGAIGLLAGPKILLLFPVWLLGVASWRLRARDREHLQVGRWVIGASVLLCASMVMVRPHWPGEIGLPPWFLSGAWLSDTLFGIGIAGLIWGCDFKFRERTAPPWLDTTVRQGAGVSFSLYLLHYPLMTLAAGIVPYNRLNVLHISGVLAVVLVFVFAFGSFFEPQRKVWARLLERVLRTALPKAQPWPAPVVAGTLRSDAKPVRS